ncbi:MAG: aminopeptidase [Oribacterium parvum]|uniref:aminopeptidase n=1 Tax=Oribacterium parvum TaxID=1501329 RepID=UPI001CB25B8D|nr:aminopeptidase [Oribacterium parvum]MBF1267932.1 aminopeptidase [Oribacterium parvum]
MGKTEGQKLEEKLFFKPKHIAKDNPKDIEKAMEFAEGYKTFLDHSKIERECVSYSVALAEKAGYKPFSRGIKAKTGDKFYYVNRGKNLYLVTIGKKPLNEGIHFNIAHIDSPRIDLKPNPLYETEELAYFKTHYYGGIKKYQWTTIPLALHGRIMLADGKAIDVDFGEKPGDPVLVITDLLPHLGRAQGERKLNEGIKGEELNILLGSLPVDDKEVKEAFKLRVLSILHDKYGITEKDFMRSELTLVPAQKAVDVGLDSSMVGAYGQDDKVCAYAALMAEFDCKKPEYTSLTALVDKEEIGSTGNTGMESDALLHFVEDLAECEGERVRDILRNSICLSSDVNAAYDPTFPDVYEKQNSSFFNHGPVLTKYTGVRGKGGSNDASAETMQKVIGYMEDAGVAWQIGELGKVDEGGGGTIAMFMGNMDVDTVDLGVAVLSMHAPFELTAKLDVYYTYKAFLAFNR